MQPLPAPKDGRMRGSRKQCPTLISFYVWFPAHTPLTESSSKAASHGGWVMLPSGSNHDPSPKFTCVLSHFLHVQLCNPMDCSPPDSSVHGIHLAGILEWVVIRSSRGSSQPRDGTHISCDCCTAGRFFISESPTQNLRM